MFRNGKRTTLRHTFLSMWQAHVVWTAPAHIRSSSACRWQFLFRHNDLFWDVNRLHWNIWRMWDLHFHYHSFGFGATNPVIHRQSEREAAVADAFFDSFSSDTTISSETSTVCTEMSDVCEICIFIIIVGAETSAWVFLCLFLCNVPYIFSCQEFHLNADKTNYWCVNLVVKIIFRTKLFLCFE